MPDRGHEWAARLGLAPRALFGSGCIALPGSHTALANGIAGSFVLSHFETKDDAAAVQLMDRANWAWSSLMPHHVAVESDEVVVTSEVARLSDRFTLESVEAQLESFLLRLEDWIAPHSMDAVDHTVLCFQKLRSILKADSAIHIATFLALVALRLEHLAVSVADLPDTLNRLDAVAEKYQINPSNIADDVLTKDFVARFFYDLLTSRSSGHALRLDLLIRHAAGELFRAAHLAPSPPTRQSSLLFMDEIELPVRPRSLKGIAYTPLGLARTLTEQALRLSTPVPDRPLTILDPACGSGTFLVEALTTLGRLGYSGKVRLIGYDISPTAIAAATFSVACTALDYPGITVDPEIYVRDFLDPSLVVASADIIVMNPPFLSWADMPEAERQHLRSELKESFKGRPDRSMIFIDRAVASVRPGGIVATLLPAGVLASDSALRWRRDLAHQATPRLVASFGEHSLFRFATVQIAALILQRDASANHTTIVWASSSPRSATDALRNLRRRDADRNISSTTDEAAWSIYSMDTEYFTDRPLWLPAPGLLGRLPELSERLSTTVGDLFDVRLGIRTGHRSAFIIPAAEYEELPEAERDGFRPIAEKHDIHDGIISSTNYLFVAGDAISTEAELKERFTRYYTTNLLKWRNELTARAGIGAEWWRLARSRPTWLGHKGPRIVSRRWVRTNGFAVDRDGSFVVVQGCAWFPRSTIKDSRHMAQSVDDVVDFLYLYCIMFSSEMFFRILREFSIPVAGGQVSVDKKYVKRVPVPLLARRMIDVPELGRLAADFLNQERFPELETRNRFASQAYGLEY
jgi:adenine-specific DNA-methyltransferase